MDVRKYSIGCFLLTLCVFGSPAFGHVSSRSIALSADGQTLISANFDNGSVSRLDRTSGQRLQEQTLGQDIRRIAQSSDGQLLAATDYTGHAVFLLRADNLDIVQRIPLPKKPFAVLYDPHHEYFWVTLFASAEVVAIDHSGTIIHRIAVAPTPRGLALTDDGRLFVTHAMTGQISILQTRANPISMRQITLHSTQNADETVSQGDPRLLDDIEISPDGKEAWLAHVLWNFDHAFQFQSTVFPSVSILDISTPGQEVEKTALRKHLFKQINLKDNANRTRIVSNPQDLSFSADGKTVYVTLSGSEDLMMFDLSRRGKANKKRHRRKKHKGGVKVTQILRHLPGQNPTGLLVDGKDIFIQNAMSLDLTLARLDGDGPFARVQIITPKLASLVAKDRVPAPIRRGKRLFRLANTDQLATTPMAGDFWMSCQSCHLDGFNFTNRFFYPPPSAKTTAKKQRVVVGHNKLANMVAGDFVGDYIRMIQLTQGGMGGDTRTAITHIDAAQPPAAVKQHMQDLHAYITSTENLPYLPTWLRMAHPTDTVSTDTWLSSASCAGCHAEIFEQWAHSNHYQMGGAHPYYQVLEDLAAAEEGEAFRHWCMGCHSPQKVVAGIPSSNIPNKTQFLTRHGADLIRDFEAGRPQVEEGTGCVFCHRVTAIENAGGNAGLTVNIQDRAQYIFDNASASVLRWAANRLINAKPEAHKQSYLNPLYQQSDYCGACHTEFAPGSGSQIVDTYGEWAASPFNNPDDPTKHKTCLDCHMHADPDQIGTDIPAYSTANGAQKTNVRSHRFVGANHFLVGLRDAEAERQSIALLRTSAELNLAVTPQSVQVTVNNVGAGHALPTGVADFRELWLQVLVKNAQGETVLRSGFLSAEGQVPASARLFRKVFGDAAGNPVGLRFWRYEQLLEDTRIPAGGKRVETFALPPGLSGAIDVQVKLLFRVYPQWVTTLVQKQFTALPNPPVITLKTLTQHLTLPSR